MCNIVESLFTAQAVFKILTEHINKQTKTRTFDNTHATKAIQ